MSNYRRALVPGATHFFTVVLEDRTSDLLVRQVDVIRQVYSATAAAHPFETIAICVMPDHLHAIWQLPDGDSDFRDKGIWQRRYWEHQIRDEEDLERHVDYIHFNPVKHGLVAQVKDWPHSSFHKWVERGDLPAAWGLVKQAAGHFGE
ncbi:MAG TPA: transposase [Ramlibacter sp.]|nr:transposase [Ramlibacter sp.]